MSVAAPQSDELRELYRELILDHARSPRHFGKLPAATHRAAGVNPLCGDKLELYLEVGEDGRIRDTSFEGSGCAISVASASLLTETVIGLDTRAALEVFATLTARLTGRDEDAIEDTQNGDASGVQLGKLRALEGVREFPTRVKCATLAWHALNSALHHEARAATTE